MKHHDEEFRRRLLERGVPLEALESARVSSATRDAALTFSLAAFDVPAKIFRAYVLAISAFGANRLLSLAIPSFFTAIPSTDQRLLNGVASQMPRLK